MIPICIHRFDTVTSTNDVALDMARARLRSMAPPGQRAGVTLSAIVASALAQALADLDENGTESHLASKLANQ